MDTILTNTILVTVIIPFMTALMVLIAGRKPNFRDLYLVLGACATFWSVMEILPHIFGGGLYEYTFTDIYPGISLKLRVDGLGAVFAGVASFLWILVSMYCIGYLHGTSECDQTGFYFCSAVAVGGIMGVAFAGNLFTLYLFYEIASFATYPLLMNNSDQREIKKDNHIPVYLFITSKAFLLSAMVLIYLHCGTLDFSVTGIMNGIFPTDADKIIITTTYILCFLGLSKAGFMVFYNWPPSSFSLPVCILVYVFIVVTLGVFSLCRIMLSVYGINLLRNTGLGMFSAYIVSFVIIMTSVTALTRTDLKTRFAYVSVSHISLIVLGVALLTPKGLTGGLIHIVSFVFSAATLFFCTGVVHAVYGKEDIHDIEGIGYQVPVIMAALVIASLSIIGIPPLGGFVTRWYMALGTMDINNLILLSIIVLSSLMNALCFFSVFYRAFKRVPGNQTTWNPEQTGSKPYIYFMIAPLAVASVITVLSGLKPDALIQMITIFMGTWEDF